MRIKYKNNKLEKVCTIYSNTVKRYGNTIALKIHQRIDEIRAAVSVEMMIKEGVGRRHQLKGERQNQYAVDLGNPYRLIFEKEGEEIQIVKIIEIVDYH